MRGILAKVVILLYRFSNLVFLPLDKCHVYVTANNSIQANFFEMVGATARINEWVR